jgi:glycosyltransferase involved in cell wall biosynthesis
MVIGYPGHFDLPLGRVLAWARRVPLVWDALVSLYETVVEDRALIAPSSFFARCLERLERWLCRLPDRIVLDTQANIAFFTARYGLAPERLVRIWVGAPESVCRPMQKASQDPFRVVYFGKFIPLHGIEQILQAAYLLREYPAIRFELLGYGQTWSAMRTLADALHLENVSFVPRWFLLEELADYVAGAGACLGVFGESPKAMRVIPVKAFVALALGLPLVTMDSPGARELLVHGETALLCKPGDPQDLAACLLALYKDPALAERLARQGQALYREQCSPDAIAQAWSALWQGLRRRVEG